ncbi:hypothetical protein [Blastococcus saxobsidens]|uniref:hypothetical protein n=1 Tax=Blastococcus saxobsidens TaxID=138336 RepID=UPI00140FA6B4|nr:hypothetical protein [Blastococcus saxobsidens]
MRRLLEPKLAWLLIGLEEGRERPEIVAVESARVGNNAVDGGPLELLAGRVSLSGNDVSGVGKLAGVVHANKVSAVGNVASRAGATLVLSSASRAEVANVDLSLAP